jgi:hypothetical protein
LSGDGKVALTVTILALQTMAGRNGSVQKISLAGQAGLADGIYAMQKSGGIEMNHQVL